MNIDFACDCFLRPTVLQNIDSTLLIREVSLKKNNNAYGDLLFQPQQPGVPS